MGKLDIIKYPDPFLKKRTDMININEINDKLRQIVDSMFEVMRKNYGIGLAANQVGLNMRMFIMDDNENTDKRIVAINPQIIDSQGEIIDREGCLSFPGISANIKRAEWIKMSALDEFGRNYEMERVGFYSRCIQHEIDHLNGITYFDHLSVIKRKILEKKYKKISKRY